ncbi:MbtH family NRPS accessory protein [Micromonospora sp. NPDC007271]|uniref:MbtH family protein n=1 Tax=Micromonospora sp. NPDC007271 TaxID=3154587 RepID=UPI0033F65678
MATPSGEHRVVLNDEEQYSVWPADRPVPDGWWDAGFHGSRDECLDHVARVWTDMRPRSLRTVSTASTADGPAC